MERVIFWKSTQLFIVLLLLFVVACTPSADKGIVYIRQNLEHYNASTVPYEETISFTMTTEEILNGLEKPMKLTNDEQTEVYLFEINEEANNITDEKLIDIMVGFRYDYHSPSGAMISQFSLSDNNMYTRGDLKLTAYDATGTQGVFARGSGDYEKGQYEQIAYYRFKEEALKKSKKWTFEISGLYLLKYEEK